ncbi:MAG: hypothetical protein H7A51_16110 [Akkermansiaceae bacterium]|nr:hypothetical protein [Akkermansiaceae bacterium]
MTTINPPEEEPKKETPDTNNTNPDSKVNPNNNKPTPPDGEHDQNNTNPKEPMDNDYTKPPGDAEKDDCTELTMQSEEGSPSDNTEPLSTEDTSKNPTEVTPKGGDIFDDLTALGRSLDEVVPSEKLLTSLPMRKPKGDEWVRCHPELVTSINIYENKDAREYYLVLPEFIEPLRDMVRHVQLMLAVNYAGVPFLWPVPVPTTRQSHHSYVSAFAAAEQAMKEWVRISWGSGDWEVFRRRTAGNEPVWPQEISNASEMLRFASKSGAFEIINSMDHPVIKHHLGLD